MRVLLAPTLTLASAIKADITVETEYGDSVVKGARYTAAHHVDEFKGNPAPCCDVSIPAAVDGETVMISHIDLDSLGGCARALGIFPEAKDFWSLASFIDLNGPHKEIQWSIDGITGHPSLSEPGAWERFNEELNARADFAHKALAAYHAWGEGRPRLPRDVVTDVTDEVRLGAKTLHEILIMRNAELLAAGEAWAAQKEGLKASSFVRTEGKGFGAVVIRKASVFVNHLYDHEGGVGKAVVAIREDNGSVTVSFADKPEGATAKDIVQALWGTAAGGHPGIAGSPRGQKMSEGDFAMAARLTSLVIDFGAKKIMVEKSPHHEGVIYAFIDTGTGAYDRFVLREAAV
jgi:hypothetical protein